MPRARLMGLLLVGACAPEPQEVQPPSLLRVGVHQVELRVPEGWLHLDQGREQRFKRELQQISMADLGPASPEGFRREISRARDLYRQGQLEDARALLDDLRPRRLFPSERRWRPLVVPWSVLLRGGKERPEDPERVERAYAEVLARVEELPPPDLPTMAEAALEELPHGPHRELLEEETLGIGENEALRIDTWDRLSHAMRRRMVFALNEGNLLVVSMDLGEFLEVQPVFDALIASMVLSPGESLRAAPPDHTPVIAAFDLAG